MPTVIHIHPTKGPGIEQIPTAKSDYAVVNFLFQNVLSYSVITISGNSADIRQKYLGQISILFEDPLYTQTNDDDFHCLKGQDLLDSIDCAMQAYTPHTDVVVE